MSAACEADRVQLRGICCECGLAHMYQNKDSRIFRISRVTNERNDSCTRHVTEIFNSASQMLSKEQTLKNKHLYHRTFAHLRLAHLALRDWHRLCTETTTPCPSYKDAPPVRQQASKVCALPGGSRLAKQTVHSRSMCTRYARERARPG